MTWIHAIALALVLLIAIGLRPWRQLRGSGEALIHPLFGTCLMLTLAWGMPAWFKIPLHLQWSGACLTLLLLGWPLATLVFGIVGAVLTAASPMPVDEVLDTALWLGVVPATLALWLGYGIRRYLPHHPLVYTLARCFFGTVISLFIAGALADAVGVNATGVASSELSRIARWLLAWGDGVVTGMVCAIFVAYKPEWLATWSDSLYLPAPKAS